MCKGYESPIELITSSISTSMDENIMRAVQSVGIVVHESELIQALKYDRDSYDKGYNKGYEQGYADCYQEITGYCYPDRREILDGQYKRKSFENEQEQRSL